MGFLNDRRGASGVVGAVLLLAILVILVSIYQAQIVPIENKQVEFDHSLDVQNDMLELRNAILESDATGRITYATVTLGTRYANRIIGINPAPASGLLETTHISTRADYARSIQHRPPNIFGGRQDPSAD